MKVYNDELYHHGKLGMKWGHRNNKINTVTKPKKTIAQHQAVGAKHVANALKILGANASRAHTLYDANKMSKMMFPD